MRWTVVIPAKALPAAKSRLAAASADPRAHRLLVEAIRADTAAAARAADGVARVLVVVDEAPEPAGSEVLVQQRPGLNAALTEAAGVAARRWPDDGVAALVGDLPALHAHDLAQALAAAAGHPRCYVRDAQGTGTTLLTARPGAGLAPSFGAGSAARHGDGAVRLDARPGLCRDVDTPDDLAAAVLLGVGSATAAVLGERVTTRSP